MSLNPNYQYVSPGVSSTSILVGERSRQDSRAVFLNLIERIPRHLCRGYKLRSDFF